MWSWPKPGGVADGRAFVGGAPYGFGTDSLCWKYGVSSLLWFVAAAALDLPPVGVILL